MLSLSLASGMPDRSVFERAFDAFQAALQLYAREEVPLDWAETQTNLGSILATARRTGNRNGTTSAGR